MSTTWPTSAPTVRWTWPGMAAAFDVSVRKLCKDLRHMLAKGILPTGYLDMAEGKLYLTEMGYRAPEPEEEADPRRRLNRMPSGEDAILREIRQVNDEIPDEEMSAKIYRIEEITGKILDYQKKAPQPAGATEDLPKLLSAYDAENTPGLCSAGGPGNRGREYLRGEGPHRGDDGPGGGRV